MRELIVNRVQPEVDPVVHAWGWEIPIDLFFAAVVSGMMILSGLALLRAFRGGMSAGATLPRVHAPLLAFALVHVCLLALFLDLSHKPYVWNLYLTLQPASPMSWGSWMLTFVYLVLVGTALIALPAQWPWLAQRVPLIARISAWVAQPTRVRRLAWANVVLGFGLVLYTGVLLATMVARPLWNTMVLPPLFLASGLAGAAAMLALAARFVPNPAAAPSGMIGGFINALITPAPGGARSAEDAAAFTRLALWLLLAQAVLLFLFVIGLASGSASQIEALRLVLSGRFALAFWLLVVLAGVVVPVVLFAFGQGMSPPGRPKGESPSAAREGSPISPPGRPKGESPSAPRAGSPMSRAESGTAARGSGLATVGLVLLLAGGLALRWVLVDAGQASRILPLIGLGQ